MGVNVRIMATEDGNPMKRGIALHQDGENKRLIPKLWPKQIVTLPDDHILLSPGHPTGRWLERVAEEATRPYKYPSEGAAYLDDPRHQDMDLDELRDAMAMREQGGRSPIQEAAVAAGEGAADQGETETLVPADPGAEAPANAQPRTRRRS